MLIQIQKGLLLRLERPQSMLLNIGKRLHFTASPKSRLPRNWHTPHHTQHPRSDVVMSGMVIISTREFQLAGHKSGILLRQ